MHTNSLSVRPLGGVFGADVTGVYLSVPPPAAVSAALSAAVSRYGLLIFRSPRASAQGIAGLMCAFGALQQTLYVNTLRNPSADEAACARPEECIAMMTDPLASIAHSHVALLHAEEAPFGGESIWCSLADAYDGISVPMRAYLDPLEVVPFSRAGFPRPLVASHPLTKRKHLGIGASFKGHILNVPAEESDLVVDLAQNLLTVPENQIRIPWARGMVVLWDCRLTQHYPVGGYGAPGWRLRCISACDAAADPFAATLRME